MSTQRVAVVLSLIAAAASGLPILASCVQPLRIYTAPYTYVITPGCEALNCGSTPTTVTDDVLGNFWVLDHGDPQIGPGIDSGTFPALGGFLYIYPGYGAFVLTTWAADARLDFPCPVIADAPRCTALALSDVDPGTGNAVFLLMTTPPDPLQNYVFDTDGDFLLGPLPTPEIVAAYRTPYSVHVNLQGPSESDLAPGLYLHPGCFELEDGTPTPPVRGYRVYLREAPVAAPLPSERRTEAWMPFSETIPLGEPVDLQVPCYAGRDRFLAVALVYDSGFVSGHVSEPVRIGCRPRRQLDFRKPAAS